MTGGRMSERLKGGVRAPFGQRANVRVVHFTNPDKGWRAETDQFAISWAADLATKVRT